MSKRSPPARPPAVLTNKAESPSSSGDGKRTRKEPDSCRRPRLVIPSSQRTSKLTAPCARLAAKIAEASRLSVRIQALRKRPRAAASDYDHRALLSQSHLAADLGPIEIAAIAAILH